METWYSKEKQITQGSTVAFGEESACSLFVCMGILWAQWSLPTFVNHAVSANFRL